MYQYTYGTATEHVKVSPHLLNTATPIQRTCRHLRISTFFSCLWYAMHHPTSIMFMRDHSASPVPCRAMKSDTYAHDSVHTIVHIKDCPTPPPQLCMARRQVSHENCLPIGLGRE